MSTRPTNATSSATTNAAGTPVKMPKLGESVTEGTLGSWLKQIGDRVEKYEPLVEVQTDKVTAEIPSPIAGVIIEILGGEGSTLAVGAPICVIDQQASAGSAAAPSDEPPAADAAADSAEAEAPTAASVPPPSADPSRDAASSNAAPSTPNATNGRGARDEATLLRTRSSPLVRRLAEEHEIDLQQMTGSGIGGRVRRDDLLAEVDRREQQAAAPDVRQTAASSRDQQPPAFHEQVGALTQTPSTPPGFSMPPAQAAPVAPATLTATTVDLLPGDRVIDAPFLRRQTADAVTRSAFTAPHVTIWMDADMSRVAVARENLRAAYHAREGTSLTWLPFVAHAVVVALREHPALNSAWDNGRIIQRQAINLGLAIGLDDGLVVPVLHHADELSLTGFARRATQLADRARAGRLQPDDVRGGTFTLNNPGTLGSLFSTPIIVQPQAGILSMEAIQKRVVVIDDAIAIRPMMNLSLSVDHRLVDGLGATRFLARVKQVLEQWSSEDGQ